MTLFALLFLAALDPTTPGTDVSADSVAVESPQPATVQQAAEPEVAPESAESIESVEVSEADPTAEWYSDAFPEAERVFDQLTARTTRPGTLEMVITHRNNMSFTKDPAFNFLGFDGGGLKIGLGLRYGILEGLDVGVFRVNGTNEGFDTYEFDGRYQILHQDNNYVDLAVRGGLTWFAQKGQSDASGFFGQVIATRIFAKRWLVGSTFSFHTDSTSPLKTTADPNYSTGLSLQSEYRFVDYFGVGAEIATTLTGYHQSRVPMMTVGPKFYTNRHTFSVVVSNSQAFTADTLITNTYRKELEDWVIGFNVIREL